MEHEETRGLVLSLRCLCFQKVDIQTRGEPILFMLPMYHEGIKTTFSAGAGAINAACFPPFS